MRWFSKVAYLETLNTSEQQIIEESFTGFVHMFADICDDHLGLTG